MQGMKRHICWNEVTNYEEKSERRRLSVCADGLAYFEYIAQRQAIRPHDFLNRGFNDT